MKRNDIIFLLTSTLILTIAWVIFNVIHASTASTISNDLTQQIEPIAPVFDAKTISDLNNRQKVIPQYSLTSTNTSASPSSIPSTSPTVVAVPTANITQSASSSPIQGGLPQ